MLHTSRKPIPQRFLVLQKAETDLRNRTIIRLHSSAGYPTTRSPIFQPSFSAATQCQTAVENIVDIAEFARRGNLLDRAGPFFAFSLWVAARVLLVHGSTIDHRVSGSINLLVNGFNIIGKHWRVAARYAALLQRVLDEYNESVRGPGEETPSTVKILADMRRTAFDLDALISRQPRHQAALPRAVTPARTPAPADLEYLDVFDFFNYPRLPISLEQGVSGVRSEGITAQGTLGEFNVGGYGFDTSSDWLSQRLETF
jgi:hypothetical protein